MRKLISLALLWILVGGATITACSTRPEQPTPASPSNATQWVGLWVLKLNDVDRPRETTLSIKEANGSITATLRSEPDKPIEFNNISIDRTSLVLKYEAQSESSKSTNAASMLTIGSDRSVDIHKASSGTVQKGRAMKVSVSQEFIDTLFQERDDELMITRAKAAGLTVASTLTSGGGSITTIVDPATGIVLMTRSTMP
jgi:hypothetical protein